MRTLQQRKQNTALLSVISNSLLVIGKLIVGVVIGSVSVISEAIHSGNDLVAAVIAFFAVRTSNKPADSKHSFGHGKYENISGAIEAILIFVAAGWIIYEAVLKLINPGEMEEVSWGILVMIVSALVNLFVSSRLFKVAKESDSIALEADAWHLRTDVYTSFGVAAGLGIYSLVRYFYPDVDVFWIDPVCAIIVALLIVRAAYDLTKKSVGGLLDESLPAEEVEVIKEIMNEHRPQLISFHDFRTRKSGADRFVEFHMVVSASMSVKESHDICDDITLKIKDKLNNTIVMIHIEPCDNSCMEKCVQHCSIKQK
ncbi:MAG: cation diffusion facilitator family transporter [Bacteroidota bacterium]